MVDPRLDIANVSVRFGQTVAVDSLSLSVAAGESVAVVGPSGCGKSTLLRAITGLQELTCGHVRVDGIDITGFPTHRRGIGLMFQDHALFEHKNVTENIEFGLEMQKTEPRQRARRVDELLALVGLEGFSTRDIPTLSGGEAQRVALARSLAPSPSILLLDEPLGALDQQRRERLAIDLRHVLRSIDQTVLYVTHDLAEAAVIADRIAIMDRGTIARIDTPPRLWADPGTEFVAQFIGLNVLMLDGELVALSPGELFAVGEELSSPNDDDPRVTITGSWFHHGAWNVSGRSSDDRELRWISPHQLAVDEVVALRATPDASVRRLEY